MATIVKIDLKTDLGITLADYNLNGRGGLWERPAWAINLYNPIWTDEQVFDDWANSIWEEFEPHIGELAAWLSIANKPYFDSDTIKGNIRKSLYKEITQWRIGVPFEVKNNASFKAQAGFDFSLSIQPWLISYDRFSIDTKTFLDNTGLIGKCIEDIENIELWVKPQFLTGEFLSETNIVRKTGETGAVEVVTKEYLDDIVQTGILNSHKQIKGDVSSTDLADMTAKVASYNSGSDITLDDGSTYNNKPYDATTNPNGATEGDIVNFIPSDVNTLMEEGYVLKSLQMVLSTNTTQNSDITDIKAKDVTQDKRLDSLEFININSLNVANEKDVVGHGVLDTSGHTNFVGRLARRDEIVPALGSLKQEADATDKIVKEHETTINGDGTTINPGLVNSVTNNVAGVTDYVNSKADFVRLEDITGSIEVDFITPIVMTEDGNDVVADLSTISSGELLTIGKFVQDRLITVQATPNIGVTFPVEYVRDSWNNTTATGNVVLGRDITVLTTFTADGITPVVREIRLSGLNNIDRTNFINDFTITSLSQLGGNAGAGIDSVARTTANAAQATATQAATTANDASSKAIANTASIATKQNRVDNSLATTAKIIPTAINELKTLSDSTRTTQAQLGSKKVSDNEELLSTAEIIATEKYVTNKFNVYEEKEITITPAIYGWKTINQTTYAFSENDIGKKVKHTSGDGIQSGIIGYYDNNYGVISHYKSSPTQAQITFWSTENIRKVERLLFISDNTFVFDPNDDIITKFEVWDIITPAVKATVLVKK